MVYTIYKTTNVLNGKIYIGKHQTENPNDAYLGSGKALKKAIRAYGVENFCKEVLFVFGTEEEMNCMEKEILTEEFISDSSNYNEAVGGEGGPHFKGKKHSEETKRRIREKNKMIILSDEAKRKISESNRRRKLSAETRKKLSVRSTLRFERMTEAERKNFGQVVRESLNNTPRGGGEDGISLGS